MHVRAYTGPSFDFRWAGMADILSFRGLGSPLAVGSENEAGHVLGFRIPLHSGVTFEEEVLAPNSGMRLSHIDPGPDLPFQLLLAKPTMHLLTLLYYGRPGGRSGDRCTPLSREVFSDLKRKQFFANPGRVTLNIQDLVLGKNKGGSPVRVDLYRAEFQPPLVRFEGNWASYMVVRGIALPDLSKGLSRLLGYCGTIRRQSLEPKSQSAAA